MVPNTVRPLGSSPTTLESIKTEPFVSLSLSVNTRCNGIKPQKCVCVTSFLQIGSLCLTGERVGVEGNRL